MRAQFVIILASILVLGLIGLSFSQDAFAPHTTISDQTSCEGIGGTWVTPNICQIIGILTIINTGQALEVSSGIILENFGTITIKSGSSLINSGTITNSGTINNFGIIDNFGTINNSNNILNCGTYTGTPIFSGNSLIPCIISVNITLTFDVTIPSGTSMTIFPVAVLTINPGITLDIDKNDGLIVQSGSGLLIKSGGKVMLTDRGP